MRFVHISDLHIGLKLLNRDLSEDQNHILGQIVEKTAALKPDALVIAGDIYDKAVPSAEAVEMLDRFLSRLTETLPDLVIMMISGNHDSAPRIDCFRSILSRQHVYMIGQPPQQETERIARVTLKDAYGPVHFYLLPFVKPSVVKKITGVQENGNNLSYDEAVRRLIEREEIDTAQRNVLVSHQFYLPEGVPAERIDRADSEIHTVGNIDEVSAAVLEPFDYAALGHIHKPMKVGSEYRRYSGTPIACSVSEAGQEKGMLLVELGPKGETAVQTIPLTPLRQVRVIRGTLAEVLARPSLDYVKVVLTDRVDLDVIDMMARLRQAFPFLLEVQRDALRIAAPQARVSGEALSSPYDLARLFMKDLTEEEDRILRDVIHTVEGGGL